MSLLLGRVRSSNKHFQVNTFHAISIGNFSLYISVSNLVKKNYSVEWKTTLIKLWLSIYIIYYHSSSSSTLFNILVFFFLKNLYFIFLNRKCSIPQLFHFALRISCYFLCFLWIAYYWTRIIKNKYKKGDLSGSKKFSKKIYLYLTINVIFRWINIMWD